MRNLFFKRINRLPKLLQLGITPTAIALQQSSGWWNARMRPLAECVLANNADNSPEVLAEALRRLFKEAQCTAKPLMVAMADKWVRMFMVTPPRNTASLEDCRAAMSMRFAQLYGDNISNWALQADWQANRPFLVCAMPAWVLDVIKAVADEYRLTLLSIVPQFVIAWNRWHPDLNHNDWFGIGHDGCLSFAAIDQNTLHSVRTIPIDAAAWQDPQWLAAHLEREALRMNLPPPSRIRLCGAIPSRIFTHCAPPLECIRLEARDNPAWEEAASAPMAIAADRGAA